MEVVTDAMICQLTYRRVMGWKWVLRRFLMLHLYQIFVAKFCCCLKNRLICAGVSIEMSLAKDQSLSVVVSGKTDAVLKARQLIVQNLQTPVCINCSLSSCLEYVNSLVILRPRSWVSNVL